VKIAPWVSPINVFVKHFLSYSDIFVTKKLIYAKNEVTLHSTLEKLLNAKASETFKTLVTKRFNLSKS